MEDVDGVSLCGALKSKCSDLASPCSSCGLKCMHSLLDVVAMAAGFVDGLGWGDNSKGAPHPAPHVALLS